MTSDAGEVGDDGPATAGPDGFSRKNDSTGSASEQTRRRRLAEIFGTVLPESTSDDMPGDDVRAGPSRDDWYLENRPPHH